MKSKFNIDGVVLISGADTLPSGGHPVFMLPVFILKCLEPHLSKEFVRLAFSTATSEQIKQESIAVNAKNDMYVCRCFYRQMEWATWRDWEGIGCPFMIIHGEDDKLVPIQKAVALHNLLQHRLPADILANSGFHTIRNAGHQIHQEKAEHVLHLLSDFISKIRVNSS